MHCADFESKKSLSEILRARLNMSIVNARHTRYSRFERVKRVQHFFLWFVCFAHSMCTMDQEATATMATSRWKRTKEKKCHDKNFIHITVLFALFQPNFHFSIYPKPWNSGFFILKRPEGHWRLFFQWRKGRCIRLSRWDARSCENMLIEFKTKKQISVSSIGITRSRIKCVSFYIHSWHAACCNARWSLVFNLFPSFSIRLNVVQPNVKNKINI